MENRAKLRMTLYSLSIILVSLLVLACASGGGDDDDDNQTTLWTITGSAADGFVLPNTSITLWNSTGDTIANGTTSASGTYTLDVDTSQITFPLLLIAEPQGKSALSAVLFADNTNVAATFLVNTVTDLIAQRLLGSDLATLIQQNPTQVAASLSTITSAAWSAEITNVTNALGVDANRFISNADFQGRLLSEEGSGSIEDDYIETLKEFSSAQNQSLLTLISSALETSTPLLTNSIVQVRLSATSLGRGTNTAANVTDALTQIIPTDQTTVLTSINQQFQGVTEALETLKTAATAKEAFGGEEVRVVLEGIEEAIVSVLNDNSSAITISDATSLVQLVQNMVTSLSDVLISSVESGIANTNLQTDGTVDLTALTSVVTSAAIQAATVALAFNVNQTLSTEASTFLTTEVTTTFNAAQTTLLDAITTQGLSNLNNTLTGVSDTVTSATSTQLNGVQQSATTAGISSESLNTNVSAVQVPSVQTDILVDTLALLTTTTTTSTTTTSSTTTTTSSTTTTTVAGASTLTLSFANTVNGTNVNPAIFNIGNALSGQSYRLLVANTDNTFQVNHTGQLFATGTTTIAVDLRSLPEGVLSSSIVSVNSIGEISTATTTTGFKDVVAPSGLIASNISLATSNQGDVIYSNDLSTVRFELAAATTGTYIFFDVLNSNNQVTLTSFKQVASVATTTLVQSLDLSALPEGQVTIRATIGDTSGNVATLGTSATFTLDQNASSFSFQTASATNLSIANSGAVVAIASTSHTIQKTAQMRLATSGLSCCGRIGVSQERFIVASSNSTFTLMTTITSPGLGVTVNQLTTSELRGLLSVTIADSLDLVPSGAESYIVSSANWTISTTNVFPSVLAGTHDPVFQLAFTVSLANSAVPGLLQSRAQLVTSGTRITVSLGASGLHHATTSASFILSSTTTASTLLGDGPNSDDI